MENLVYLFGCFLSCVIIARLLFQFMGDRYEKAFVNPWVYRIAAIIAVVIITMVNLKRSALWNAAANFLIYSFIVFFFYEDRDSRKYWRVLETDCFFIMTALFEGFGVYGIDFLMDQLGLMPEDVVIRSSIEAAFFKAGADLPLLCPAESVMEKRLQGEPDTGDSLPCYVFIQCGKFHYPCNSSHKESGLFPDLRQFGPCYLCQPVSVLFPESGGRKKQHGVPDRHDVSKHIHSIEELYQAGVTDKALEYTKQIGSILKPLVPEEYSDTPMLNILLADRKQTAESIGIRFVVQVESTWLGFIEPVDVTTLFGNLLENGSVACDIT